MPMRYALILSLTLFLNGLHAQTGQDSTALDSVDQQISELSTQLENYEKLLRANREKRMEDSLARVDLLRRIRLLQESDELNQATLREQIKAIETRDSARNADQRVRIQQLKQTNNGHLVDPLKDSLFTVYTKLGPMTAEARAKRITTNIEKLVAADFFYEDSLKIVQEEGTFDILYEGTILCSISDWDVLWVEEISKASLAERYVDAISSYVTSKRNRSSIQNMAARIGLVFLIIGGVFLVLYFIRMVTSGIQGWMISNKKKYFKGFRTRNVELLPPEIHLESAIRLIGLIKWGLFILTFYLSLPLVFGLFPFTRGWAQMLLDWVLKPVNKIWFGFWDYLPNLFAIVVIYVITRYLVKTLKFVMGEVSDNRLSIPGFYPEWAKPTYRLAKLLIYAFMLVMIWPYLPGSDSEIFKGVAIFIGLMIALGSSTAVSNAIAGFVATYMRPFKIGDQVKIGDVFGVVTEKNMLATRIRTSKNEEVTVPNASILNKHTINYTSNSKKHGLVVNTSVIIGYEVPWEKVHERLIEAAVASEGVNISREPYVLQKSLEKEGVLYELNAFTDAPDQLETIYSTLHIKIREKLKEANIEVLGE